MNYGRAGLNWMLELGRSAPTETGPEAETRIEKLEKRVDSLEKQLSFLIARPRRPLVDIRMPSMNGNGKLQTALERFSKGLLP